MQDFLDSHMHCPVDLYHNEMWKLHKECCALGHAGIANGRA